MKRVLLLVIFAWACGARMPLTTGLEGSSIPDLKLMLTDSIHFVSTASPGPGKTVVLVNVSAHCPYCRAQLKDICARIDEVKDIQFYFSSTDPLSEVKKLYQENSLSRYANIILGADTSAAFSRYFKTKKVPCTAIYDSNKKLKGVYEGTMQAREIKELAN